MGKLKKMVKEESSLANRIKYNTRRVRLAGIGLVSKMEEERIRLYKQLMEAGQGMGNGETLMGKINTLSAGAAKLVRDETQRIFEELVQAGERANGGTANKAANDKSSARAANENKAKPKPKAVKPEAPAQAKSTPETNDAALRDSLKRVKDALDKLDVEDEERMVLEALYLQAAEGDVKGRRPAAGKEDERALYDARRELKGLTPEEAIEQFSKQLNALRNAEPA